MSESSGSRSSIMKALSSRQLARHEHAQIRAQPARLLPCHQVLMLGSERARIDDAETALLVKRTIPGHIAEGRERHRRIAILSCPLADRVQQLCSDAASAVLGQDVHLVEMRDPVQDGDLGKADNLSIGGCCDPEMSLSPRVFELVDLADLLETFARETRL